MTNRQNEKKGKESGRGEERRGEERRGQDRTGQDKTGQGRTGGKRRERQQETERREEGSDPRGALMCRACPVFALRPWSLSVATGMMGRVNAHPHPHNHTPTHPPHLSKTTNKCGASLLVPFVAVFAVCAVRCCGTYIRATIGEATPDRVVGQSTSRQASRCHRVVVLFSRSSFSIPLSQK